MTTREMVAEAVELRFRGMTWDEIGEEFGYTGHGIYMIVKKFIFGDPKTRKGVGRYTYVNGWTRRNGVTLTELSRMLGYDKHYVSLILRGDKPMPKPFLEKLSEVTGLKPDEILVLSEKEKP